MPSVHQRRVGTNGGDLGAGLCGEWAGLGMDWAHGGQRGSYGDQWRELWVGLRVEGAGLSMGAELDMKVANRGERVPMGTNGGGWGRGFSWRWPMGGSMGSYGHQWAGAAILLVAILGLCSHVGWWQPSWIGAAFLGG